MTYRGTVAIISLAFYVPALFLALFISYVQGPGNNAAYVYLTLFECVRITGFGIQLYAETSDPHGDKTFSNTTYYTWVAILLNIGMSPLLLSTVGMLSRVDGAVGRRMASILLMIAIPILLALALCIAGSIDPSSQEGPTFSANGEIKAAVALYLLCFLQLCYATILILFRHHLAKRDNQLLAWVVALSLPFMFVRVMYITLFAFADHGNSTFFNVISGNETTQLCMQVVQEYVIVVLYSVVGLLLSRRSRERERAIEEAHPGLVELEKERGPVKKALRYVPVVFWFITLREIGTLQEH